MDEADDGIFTQKNIIQQVKEQTTNTPSNVGGFQEYYVGQKKLGTKRPRCEVHLQLIQVVGIFVQVKKMKLSCLQAQAISGDESQHNGCPGGRCLGGGVREPLGRGRCPVLLPGCWSLRGIFVKMYQATPSQCVHFTFENYTPIRMKKTTRNYRFYTQSPQTDLVLSVWGRKIKGVPRCGFWCY